MSVELVIANLLRIAKADLQDARVLLGVGSRNAPYFLEQAAEKVILAVLTSEGKHGNVKHHLSEMVNQVPDANPLKPMLKGSRSSKRSRHLPLSDAGRSRQAAAVEIGA